MKKHNQPIEKIIESCKMFSPFQYEYIDLETARNYYGWKITMNGTVVHRCLSKSDVVKLTEIIDEHVKSHGFEVESNFPERGQILKRYRREK